MSGSAAASRSRATEQGKTTIRRKRPRRKPPAAAAAGAGRQGSKRLAKTASRNKD